MTPAILARRLTKRFGSTVAIDGLDLRVERGELYGLVGPNGAGKSTTLRVLLGLVRPTSGEVRLLDAPPDLRSLARVGAIVEEPAFWGHLSGGHNLRALARAGGGDDAVRRLERIDASLERAGLSGAAARKVRTYSRGMRQRLGLAWALLGDPDLLILDEPTSALDERGVDTIRALLREFCDRGGGALITGHSAADLSGLCDRVGVMVGGRLAGQPTGDRDASDVPG